MASNGGTLHGGPQPIHQPSSGGFTCSQCGLLFDSGASLQVHMHYHHEQQQQQQTPRWQSPSSTNSGNNSPPTDHHHNQDLKHTKCVSPPASAMNGASISTNTIAAADSSDNQPATPSSMEQNGTRVSYGNQEINYYQHSAYEQQHYQPHYSSAGADYPGSTTATAANNNLMMQPPHEYKSRYHPYSSPVNHSNTSPSTTQLNSASPRIVSSSSPSSHHNNNQHLGQPTPSPSPKQCDKCGLVCATVSELNEHYVSAHSTTNGDFSAAPGNYAAFGSNSAASPIIKEEPPCDILDLDSQKMVYPPHHNNNDPSLLNNNNGEGPLPSMQSLHTIQRHHPAMWQHHTPSGNDVYHIQQQQQQQRSAAEYGMMSPVMKSEYGSATIPLPAQSHLSSSPSSGGVPSIKSEYMEMKQFDQSSTTSPSDFPTTTTPQDSNNNNTGAQFRTFEPPTSSLPSSAISSAKSTAWKSNEARRPKTYNCTACNKWFTSSGHLKRHYNTTLHKNAVKASNQPDPATMPISAHHHPARDPNSKHHRNSQAANNHPPPQPQPPPTDPQRSPDYGAQGGGFTNQSSSLHQHSTQGFQQYSASLHSSAGIPPNGQAGPSVPHASLPRGLLTYSTNHLMEVHPQPPQQQQLVLQQHTISSEATSNHISSMQAERDPLSLSPTTTTHHLSAPSITTITSEQQQLMPIIISTTSMEPPLPLGYISNRLATTTTTSPLSRLEAIHPPLSYHTIIGSRAEDCEKPATEEEDTDGMIISGGHNQQHTISSTPYGEFTVSSATDAYTIRVLANAQDIGDTAPYSPSMPHDPFKQQPLLAMSASGFDRRGFTYVQEHQHGQDQIMMQLPKLAATAPDLCPSPSSPSVSSSDSVLMEHKQQQQQQSLLQASLQPPPQQLVIQDGATKKFQCVQCDKTFNKSCYLTQHNKTFHSGEKPFKCHRCGKRFSCDQSHEEHVAKHSGDKPFKCELCPKAFNHKTDLRRHMCLHSGRKPFHCDQCGKGFIRKDHLVKHMEVHTRKAEQMKRKMEQQQQPGEKAKRIKLEPQYEGEEEEEEDSHMSMIVM